MDIRIPHGVLTIGVSPDIHGAPPKYDLQKCQHNSLGYHDHLQLCEEATKAKQKQTRCALCSLFKWPCELCDAGTWEKDHPQKLKHLGGKHYEVIPRTEPNPFLPLSASSEQTPARGGEHV